MIEKFVGVLYKFINSKNKLKFEERKEQHERRDRLCENKPILWVKELKELSPYDCNEKCDMDVLIHKILDFDNTKSLKFYYDDNLLDTNNWCSVIYELSNKGGVTIENITLSIVDTMNTVLFDLKDEKYLTLFKRNLYNNKAIYNIVVKPGDSFKIRINYLQNQIDSLYFGHGIMHFWSTDVRGALCNQTLNGKNEYISTSELSTNKKFYDLTNENKILDEFWKMKK